MGLTLAGVAEPDPNRLSLLPGVRHFDSWLALVNSRDIDVVLIASPSDTHCEIALKALAAGKHILLEKPIALNMEDADRLCEAEQASGNVAGVGLYLRHLPLFCHLREQLPSAGGVTAVMSAFHNHLNRRQTVSGYERRRSSGGGVLYDLAYHHFDLYRWLLPTAPVAVDCRLRSIATDDDVAVTRVTMADGSFALGSFSSVTYNENSIRLYGDAGAIAADMYADLKPRGRRTGEGNAARVWRTTIEGVSSAAVGVNIVPRVKLSPFIAQWRSLRDTILGDPATTTLARIEEGRAALRLVSAAYTSATTGREVRV